MKAVYSCTAPYRGFDQCSSKRLFYCPFTSTVPHTLISAPDCGSVGGKRFTLTQGGRVHEGSAPSDKQACRLIVDCCRDKFSGLINKAAELYTGVSPIQDSPKAESRLLTNHHPYRSPCIVKRKVTMNKQEANQLLNQVRGGILHPPSAIIKALTITGDIHARCFDLDSGALSRGTDSPDCHSPSCQLPSVEG